MPSIREDYADVLGGRKSSIRADYADVLTTGKPNIRQDFADVLSEDVSRETLSSLRLDTAAQPAASTAVDQRELPITSLSDLAFGVPEGRKIEPMNLSPTRFTESALGEVDKAFGVPKSLDDLNLAQIPRTVARGAIGAAGYLPSLGEQLISPPEGQTRGQVAGEAGKGILQMFRRFPIQIARLAGIKIDPSKPLNPIDKFLIEQKLVQPETMAQIEQGLLASPEEPFFSAAMGSGIARGLTKRPTGVAEQVAGKSYPDFKQPKVEPSGRTTKLPTTEGGSMARAAKKYPHPQFDVSVIDKIVLGKEGDIVGTVGDFVHGAKTRMALSEALDVPIMILNRAIEKGRVVENKAGLEMAGSFGTFRGKPTIFVSSKAKDIPKTIIEEAGHALRDKRGRKGFGGGFEELTTETHDAFIGEKSATKFVDYVMGIKETKLPTMADETLPFAEPPQAKPTQKQPWEMTRDESVDFWRDRNWMKQPDGTYTRLSESTGQEVKISPQEIKSLDATTKATHRFSIEDAIAEGKTIPPEVLKDYPDLAQPKPTVEEPIVSRETLPQPKTKAVKPRIDEDVYQLQKRWSEVEEAFKLWNSNQLYQGYGGNYRLKNVHGKPITPLNKAIRATYESSAEFHDAAKAFANKDWDKVRELAKSEKQTESQLDPISKFQSNQQAKGVQEAIKKTEPFKTPKSTDINIGDVVEVKERGIPFRAKVIGKTKEGQLLLNAKVFEPTASGRLKRTLDQVKKLSTTPGAKAVGLAAIPTIATLSEDETKDDVVKAAGLFGLFVAGKKTSPRMSWGEATKAGLSRKEWLSIRRAGEILDTPAGKVPISTLPKETGAVVGRTVRWDKYDVSQKDMAKFEGFTKDLGLSTRSVRTFEDMKRAAAELGTKPEELLSLKQVGDAESLALRNYLNATTKYISNLEKQMSAKPELAGELQPKIEAADIAIKQGLKKLLPASTEAGRTVVSYRILANGDLTPELWYRRAIKELGDTEQFTPKVRQTIDGLIENSDLNGLAQYVTSLRRADWVEKLMNLRKAGLLTSPVTHARNLLGNFSFAGIESISNPVSAGMDFLVKSLWTGRRTESFSLGGLKQQAVGLFKEGPKKAWQYIKTGQDPYGLMRKWDIHRQVNYDSEILNKYTQGVYRVLGAGDKMFFEKGLRGSLFEQARVQAMNEGLKIFRPGFKERVLELFNKPTDEMVGIAVDEANYVTFRKPNQLSDLVTDFKSSQLRKIREAETPSQRFGARAFYAGAEQFMPFAVTPAAIAKNIFVDYTPAGGFMALLELPKIKESAFAQRRFVKGMGRSVTGTGLITLGYLLAEQGLMTGKSPEKPSDRAAWEAQGKQPFSVRIGNQWVQVNSFTGPGNLMTFGADMHDILKSGEGVGAKVLKTGAAALESTTELSPLKGIQQIGQLIKDPEREAARTAGQQIGSFVPSIVAQGARMADSKLLKPSTTAESVKSRIPGMRGEIPPKRDIFGEEIKIETSAAEQAISPVYRRAVKNEALMKELEKLDVDISYPSQTIKGTKLTGQQYDQYLAESGKKIKEMAERLVKIKASDEGKRRVIERNIDRIRTQIRYKLFSELYRQR